MTSGTLAALLVVVGVGIGICTTQTQAQSDYDSNASFGPTEQSQGLPVLAPNGCRAKGFSATTANGGQKVCRNRLVFLDQFNGLDASMWQQEVQISDEPDYEFTVYDKDPKNLYILENKGILHIGASLTEEKYGQDFVMTGSLDLPGCTSSDASKCSHHAESFDIIPPVQSARITTKNALSFRYGTIDIRARMPTGDWLYPIITLRPVKSAYGPNYASGEIRFPCAIGNRKHHNTITAGIALQPPGSRGDPTFFSVNFTNTNGSDNYQRTFHVYRLVWSPDGFEFFIGGNSIGTLSPPEGGWAALFDTSDTGAWLSGTRMAPFDQEFYLTIGMAAGGVSRFPDGPDFPDKPWMNISPKAMLNFWKNRDKWQQSWGSPRVEVAWIKIRALNY